MDAYWVVIIFGLLPLIVYVTFKIVVTIIYCKKTKTTSSTNNNDESTANEMVEIDEAKADALPRLLPKQQMSSSDSSGFSGDSIDAVVNPIVNERNK